MGIKLYIEDDLNREFTNMEWALSDTKFLSDILLNRIYLKVLTDYFHLTTIYLDEIRHYDDIDASDKKWFDIKSFLKEIRNLKNAIEPALHPFGTEIFLKLNQQAMKIKDSDDWVPDFSIDYFIRGGFFDDLDDLERLLYFLLHTGAKKVHLYCA